jgi:hypothetical protein
MVQKPLAFGFASVLLALASHFQHVESAKPLSETLLVEDQ